MDIGIKRPGRQSEHFPPSNTRVKNVWKYASTPYAFMASNGTSSLVPLLAVSAQYRIQVSWRIDLAVDTLILD
jgi:hypothetical protein